MANAVSVPSQDTDLDLQQLESLIRTFALLIPIAEWKPKRDRTDFQKGVRKLFWAHVRHLPYNEWNVQGVKEHMDAHYAIQIPPGRYRDKFKSWNAKNFAGITKAKTCALVRWHAQFADRRYHYCWRGRELSPEQLVGVGQTEDLEGCNGPSTITSLEYRYSVKTREQGEDRNVGAFPGPIDVMDIDDIEDDYDLCEDVSIQGTGELRVEERESIRAPIQPFEKFEARQIEFLDSDVSGLFETSDEVWDVYQSGGDPMELMTRIMNAACEARRETREFSELDLAAAEGSLDGLAPSMFRWLDEGPRESVGLLLQANTPFHWVFSG